MGELSIQQIVERCKQNDREAFGLLYTVMHDRLRRVCRRYAGDESTADDLLHDAFLLIFQKLGTLRDPAKAEQWMVRVTKNLSLMYLQQQKQQGTVSLDELDRPAAAAAGLAVRTEPTIGTQADMPITYDEILNLIETLPEGQRQVFRLSVLEGLNHQQIASLLNIEPHTSSSQLYRAKRLLRQSLGVLLAVVALIWLWPTKKIQPNDSPASDGGNLYSSVPADSLAPVQDASGAAATALVAKAGHSTTGAAKLTAQTTAQAGQEPTAQATPQDSVETAAQTIPQDVIAPTAQSTVQGNAQEQIHHAVPQDAALPEIGRGGELRSVSVALAYSGVNGNQSFNLPYASTDMNEAPIDTVTRHQMPITVALSVSKPVGRHWAVGTGVQYTLLRSETQEGNSSAWTVNRQRIGYLGIPLRLEWHPLHDSHWRLYAAGSAMMELPLHKSLRQRTFVQGSEVEAASPGLHGVPVQWSVGGGLGVEYRLSPTVGLYAEPTLHYFFRNGGPDTYRTEHPASLSLPLGLRISLP